MTERHADVQRAAATFRWTGSWHTVFLTVDRSGGARSHREFDSDIAQSRRALSYGGTRSGSRQPAVRGAGNRPARMRRGGSLSQRRRARAVRCAEQSRSARRPARSVSSGQFHFRPAGLFKRASTPRRTRSPASSRWKRARFSASAWPMATAPWPAAVSISAGWKSRGWTTIVILPSTAKLTISLGGGK